MGSINKVTVFTSGTGTHVLDSLTRKVRFRVVGGGGGGAGAQGSSGNACAGSGGGAGGYAELWVTAPVSRYDWSVGPGGAGGAGQNAGTDGTGTIVATGGGGGTILSALGGTGGVVMTAGTTVTNSSVASAGAGVGGDVNIAGGQGYRGRRTNGTLAEGGIGGSSQCGRGGPSGFNLAGSNGSGFGSGGGGASSASATSNSGGAGAGGLLIIEEFLGASTDAPPTVV